MNFYNDPNNNTYCFISFTFSLRERWLIFNDIFIMIYICMIFPHVKAKVENRLSLLILWFPPCLKHEEINFWILDTTRAKRNQILFRTESDEVDIGYYILHMHHYPWIFHISELKLTVGYVMDPIDLNMRHNQLNFIFWRNQIDPKYECEYKA